MNDIDILLYRDALLELARAARSFAQAIVLAAARASRVTGDDDPLSAAVATECRDAILKAFAEAPGMLPLFVGENQHDVAAYAADDVPAWPAAGDQGG